MAKSFPRHCSKCGVIQPHKMYTDTDGKTRYECKVCGKVN